MRLRKAFLTAATGLVLATVTSLAPAFVWPSMPERLGRVLEEGDVQARREAASKLSGLLASQAEPLVAKALGDEDVEVRLLAARAGARLHLATAAEAVIPWLSEADSRLRLAACEVLRKVPLAKATAALGRVLSDPEPRVRMAAARALGELDGSEALTPLLSRLDDSQAAVRVEVVRSLSRLADRRATFALASKLADAAPEVRAEAARALGRSGDAQSASALILVLRDQSPEVAVAALDALGRLRAQEAVPAIGELLDDTAPGEVSKAAFRALGEIGSSESVAVLVRSLSREAPEAELAAVRKALAATGPRAAEPLLSLLGAPPSPRAAEQAALAAAELGDVRVPAAILAGIRRGHLTPEAGLRALARAGDASVMAEVLEFLTHSRASVRMKAAQALVTLLRPEAPDGRAVEPLVEALRRKGIAVEEKALLILALGRTGSPRALPELGYWAKTKELRPMAVTALGELGPAGQDEVLLEALEDEQASVRWEAAKALAATASDATTLHLLERLVDAPGADRGALGIAVSGAMARTMSDTVAERAAELGEQANGPARDALIEGLGRLKGARAGELLARLAREGGEEDRRKVAEALAGHPEAAHTLLSLADDPAPAVRSAAIWSLGAIAMPAKEPSSETAPGRPERSRLERALASIEDPDGQVVANAVAAVARLAKAEGDQDARAAAVTALCTALDDRRGYVRLNALAGLRWLDAHCGDGAKARALLRRDPSEMVRMAAAKLLASVPAEAPEQARRALVRCEIDEASARVAAVCRRGEPERVAAATSVTVFVVPDGKTEPVPGAPFALMLADGFVRLGLADRRGALHEHAAPRGPLSLLPASEP